MDQYVHIKESCQNSVLRSELKNGMVFLNFFFFHSKCLFPNERTKKKIKGIQVKAMATIINNEIRKRYAYTQIYCVYLIWKKIVFTFPNLSKCPSKEH